MQDGGAKTLVMPLKNGTQKDLGLDPDFRRDDEEGKFPERRQQGASAPKINGNKGLQPLVVKLHSVTIKPRG